ncbi:VOC family protein [Spirochaeta cellobiosiphila]|uniref:VOC family protein n=1 Tax=Spirochaeta cellobiosiphila TaxID=504483 RepID=UPI0004233903|nr:VOC family protein [Spirochaeta cellobiosiphila]
MNFVSIRLITNNVANLVQFYEQITNLTAIRYTEDFAELKIPSCTIAIASTRTIKAFGSEGIHAANNNSTIIEFFVEDVDKTFDQLRKIVNTFVMEPTTMPWGNRSILFKDPDGNLINFFTPTSEEALKRFTKPE